MKIDIVNPIPAKKPTPIICCQLLFSGSLLIFNFIDKNENKLIPKTLPKNNPKIIPKPKVDVKAEEIPELMKILVFANAKMGIIKKLTGKCSFDSNFSKDEISVFEIFVGMVNANKTPAIVA